MATTRPAPHGKRAALESHRLEQERIDAIGQIDPELLEAYIASVVASPINLAQIVKIDGPKGPEWFDLWPDQEIVLQAAVDHRKVVVLKARQLGVTWTMMLLALWECIAYPTGTTLVVSLNEEEAIEALNRAKFMYDSTPEWFKAVFPVGKSNASIFAIQHQEGSSRINAISSSGKAGRGRTLRRIIADERPHWENESDRMASLYPAVADSGAICEVGTANGRNGYYDTWNASVDVGVRPELGNGYVRIFIGALSHPDRNPEWVNRQRQLLDAQEPGLGAQEYPLTAREAFKSSGMCVFDDAGLAFQADYGIEPPKMLTEIRKTTGLVIANNDISGRWRVWEKPRRGRDYLISADVCGGVKGGDYSFAAVWDRESWDVVATFHDQPDPEEFAEELRLAGFLYTSEVHGVKKAAELAPEANNHGQAVCALLREWKYPRVYRSEQFDELSASRLIKLGWQTNQKTRPLMLQSLQTYIREASGSLRDIEIVNECARFVEKERRGSGVARWEADTGAHDDRVMGTAIGVAILTHSRSSVSRSKQPLRRRTRYTPRISSKTGY